MSGFWINEKPTSSQTLLAVDKRADLVFKNISYSANDKTQPDGVKQILKNIHGFVRPGQVLAIMGPSGSGKTTLLDLLANRLSSGHRQGDVLVHNAVLPSDEYQHVCTYVTQEDHILGTMTVRETFDFAANLKLRRVAGQTGADGLKARGEVVSRVIKDLGLESCLDTRIGTVFKKGLSGGQIRRVGIGIEILDLPPLLFLDEPTSGLDAAAAFNVVEALQRLAGEGLSVVCTIHQPSSEVFDMLDNVMLLSEGRTVFFGKGSNIVPYFRDLGHHCPEYTNPADFVMRIINTDFDGHADVAALADTWERTMAPSLLSQLVSSRVVSSLTQRPATTGFAIPVYKQFYYIFMRQSLDNIRNPGVYWIRLFMYVMLSLMVGTSYLNIGHNQVEIQDRFSMLFYINAFMVFMSIAVVPTFIQDRLVFMRERANGWYNPAAYVLSGALSCIPGLLLISLMCSIIIYFLVGLNSDPLGERFGLFFVALFTSLYCAESVVLVVSAIVPYYIIAMAFGAGIYGMFMLGQGALVLPGNIPDWWIWNYYIAFHSYAFEVFMWAEFDGQVFKCNSDPTAALIEQACRFPTGQDVLEYYEMQDAKVWRNLVIIVAMALFYRIVFWIILHVFHRGKR